MARTVEVPDYEVHGEVQVDPAKTALVVVDMQNDFVKEGGSLVVPDAEGTIPAVRKLLGLARGSGMRVVLPRTPMLRGTPSGTSGPITSRKARVDGRSSTSSRRARVST